jgi:hypothetical protein
MFEIFAAFVNIVVHASSFFLAFLRSNYRIWTAGFRSVPRQELPESFGLLLFAQALIGGLCSSRKRSSAACALRASAHRRFVALRASAHRRASRSG